LKNNETVPQLNKKNFSNFINLCSKIQTTKPTSKMNYSIKANSVSKHDANLSIKQSEISFGTTPETAETLPNPAELFLGSFSACILKNVERFSVAEITVSATRLEKPPRMDDINYELKIYSKDNTLNIELLKKNIEKHGTIFNTVQTSCTIVRNIEIIPE
jgi:uncharacterized OsmC-like protein